MAAIEAAGQAQRAAELSGDPAALNDAGKMGAAVFGVSMGVVGKAGAASVKSEVTAVPSTVSITSQQQQNVSRFTSKLPVNAKDTVSIKALPNDGIAAQATSAGRVPGSSAVYEKQIDSNGKTMQYTKTTYDPKGNIVNVKDKISNETIAP
jgi:hypothetical protein